MTHESEVPIGCLACNPGPTRRWLEANGFDPDRWVLLPIGWHAADTVICGPNEEFCGCCGRTWLWTKATPQTTCDNSFRC